MRSARCSIARSTARRGRGSHPRSPRPPRPRACRSARAARRPPPRLRRPPPRALRHLAHPVLVDRDAGEPGLRQPQLEVRIRARLDEPADATRRGDERRPEQPAEWSSGVDLEVEGGRRATERRSAGNDVRTDARREPRCRRHEQPCGHRDGNRDATRGEDDERAHDSLRAPRTRGSGGVRPRRVTSRKPARLSTRPTAIVATPAPER